MPPSRFASDVRPPKRRRNGLGRVLGAAGPTLIGAPAATRGFPLAISLLSLIYVVGLPFIALAPEAANRPLAK